MSQRVAHRRKNKVKDTDYVFAAMMLIIIVMQAIVLAWQYGLVK
jgi:hypothetical protein